MNAEQPRPPYTKFPAECDHRLKERRYRGAKLVLVTCQDCGTILYCVIGATILQGTKTKGVGK